MCSGRARWQKAQQGAVLPSPGKGFSRYKKPAIKGPMVTPDHFYFFGSQVYLFESGCKNVKGLVKQPQFRAAVWWRGGVGLFLVGWRFFSKTGLRKFWKNN